MSTVISGECWKIEGMRSTEKFVLISLADQANDEGVCWPSVATMARRTGLSERAVRYAIQSLTRMGFVVADARYGRSNVFKVTPSAGTVSSLDESGPPARGAPLQDVHPCTTCTPPLHVVHPTPARGAPRTVIEPSRNRHTADERAGSHRSPAIDPRFDEFWSAYPKKVGKPAAQRAWKAAKVNDETHQAMLAGIAKHRGSPQWTKDNGDFIPHPSTWINQRRWEDEPVNGSRSTYQQPEFMRHAK